MPLFVRLRAKEQAFLNGALITNTGQRTIIFTVDDSAVVLRRRDAITLEEADTPLKRAYFYSQLMYLDPENLDTHRTSFLKHAQSAFFTLQDEDQRSRLFMTAGWANAGDTLAVLKTLRTLYREVDSAQDSFEPQTSGNQPS